MYILLNCLVGKIVYIKREEHASSMALLSWCTSLSQEKINHIRIVNTLLFDISIQKNVLYRAGNVMTSFFSVSLMNL